MYIDLLTVAVLGVVLLATLTQSTFGFANALMAMPLLTLLAGIETATPLVALLSTTVAFGVVVKDWRDIRFSGGWLVYLLLVGSSLVGIPIGLNWLQKGPSYLVKSILAVVVIGFAIFRLWRSKKGSGTCCRNGPQGAAHKMYTTPFFSNDKWIWCFGFCAGLLGGAYNTYGPPVVVYGTLRDWSREQFRVNMQAYFVPVGSAILFGHWWNGYWSEEVGRYYLFGLPVILLAVLAGRMINQILPVQRFFTALYIILIIIGLSLLGNSLWEVLGAMV